MRLTPSQMAMVCFLGEWLPFTSEWTVKERIAHGHESLVRITGEDLGLDPQRWHDRLRQDGAGGYRWSNKHLGMPGRIAKALANPEWHAAAAELREELPFPLIPAPLPPIRYRLPRIPRE